MHQEEEICPINCYSRAAAFSSQEGVRLARPEAGCWKDHYNLQFKSVFLPKRSLNGPQ